MNHYMAHNYQSIERNTLNDFENIKYIRSGLRRRLFSILVTCVSCPVGGLLPNLWLPDRKFVPIDSFLAEHLAFPFRLGTALLFHPRHIIPLKNN